MYEGSYDQKPPTTWNLAEYYKEWRQLVGDQLLGGEAQLGFPDPLWVDPYKQILPNQTKSNQRKN